MLLSLSPDCDRVIEVIEFEKIQKKVARVLKGVEKLSSESRLRRQGLQPGEERLRMI